MIIENRHIQQKRFLPSLTLAALVSFTLLSGCSKSEKIDPNYPSIQSVSYSFRLQNNVNRKIPKANISFYLPLTKTSRQSLLDHSISITDDFSVRVLEDSLGNKLLSLSSKALPNGYSTTVKVDAKIGFSEKPVEFDEAHISRYLAQSSGEGNRLLEQFSIEFSAEDNVLTKVQTLSAALSSYDNVVKNGSTKNPGNRKQQVTVDTVNNSFASDCLQQVDRFVAVARAVGIPARVLVGFLKQGQDTFRLTCWPEVYDQSYWKMVDFADHTLTNKPAGDIVALRALISLEDYRQSQLSDLLSEGYGLAVSYSIN